MRCRVPLSTLAQRLTSATYKGQPSGVVGSNYNYSYALSDTVAAGKFWVLLYASALSLQTSGSTRQGLWVVNPGVLPASNLSPYNRNNQFFQGDIIPTIANGPPVGYYGTRIDEIWDNNTDDFRNGAEQVFLRSRKIIVPERCTLMAYGGAGGFGVGGGIGEQYQLQIFYAEFNNDEAVEVVAEVAF